MSAKTLERRLFHRTIASATQKPAGEYGEAADADLQEHPRP